MDYNLIFTTFLSIMQTITVSMVIFLLQRKRDKKETDRENRAKMREEEARLAMKLSMATGKLSFGCAVALERGKANGEIKEAKSDWEKVKKEYLDFLNKEAFEHLQDM